MKDQEVTRFPDKFKVCDLVHIKRHSPSTWDPIWESCFQIIIFSTHHSADIESSINHRKIYAKIGDLHLANPLDILENESMPFNNW